MYAYNKNMKQISKSGFKENADETELSIMAMYSFVCFVCQACGHPDLNYTPFKFPLQDLSGCVLKILKFGLQVRF